MKEAGCKNVIDFHSVQYLYKMALKRSEITLNKNNFFK